MIWRHSQGLVEALIVEYGWGELSSNLLKAHIALLLSTALENPQEMNTLAEYRDRIATLFLKSHSVVVPDVFTTNNNSRANFLDLLILLRDNIDNQGTDQLLNVVSKLASQKRRISVQNIKAKRYFVVTTEVVDDTNERQEWYFWNHYDSPVSLYAGYIHYYADTVEVLSRSDEIKEEYTSEIFAWSKEKILEKLFHHDRYQL